MLFLIGLMHTIYLALVVMLSFLYYSYSNDKTCLLNYFQKKVEILFSCCNCSAGCGVTSVPEPLIKLIIL